MKSRAMLLLFSSFIVLLNYVNCDEMMRQGRILNRNDYDDIAIEKQLIQEYSGNSTAIDATADDVIEEIISSSRQGRNIEGLDDIYSDSTIKEALDNGNEIEARNLIRDKLCSLGLMQCDEIIHGKRPGYPPHNRIIYSQPPPGAVIYNNRPSSPQQQQQIYNRPPQQQQIQQISRPPAIKTGMYGAPKPMPYPPNQSHQTHQPPRKIGYAHSDLNTFESSPFDSKYTGTDFYEVEQGQSAGVKFGYTEKPTIVVNQGKREASSSTNHHVHHHYVHVDGQAGSPGLIDGTKTVLVNTPISEYSAVNSLSSSYQTSGFGASGSASNLNGGFTPMNVGLDYKGVNSGSSGIYSQGTSIKPVYEASNSQYANYNKYSQGATNSGPAVFTEGNNGLYGSNSNVQQSYHSSAPDFYKKELNLNNVNRVNGLNGGGYSSSSLNHQQQQQGLYNSQKQQQLYTKNPYSQFGAGNEQSYQGFQSDRQDQFDCVCVSFDQCPAEHIVGRRDDLILPLDPRNLPTEIEAADNDNTNNSTSKAISNNNNSTTIADETKRSKRNVPNASDDDLRRVQGEGVSSITKLLFKQTAKKNENSLSVTLTLSLTNNSKLTLCNHLMTQTDTKKIQQRSLHSIYSFFSHETTKKSLSAFFFNYSWRLFNLVIFLFE